MVYLVSEKSLLVKSDDHADPPSSTNTPMVTAATILAPYPFARPPAPLCLAPRYCPSWEREILLYVKIIQSKHTLNLGANGNCPRFVCVYSNVRPHVLRKAFDRVLETPPELDPWKWRWLLVVRPGEETHHCQGMCSSDNNSLLLDKETAHAFA